MADIHSIHGDKIEVDDGVHGLLTKLKDLIAKIEVGEMKPEKWLLLVETQKLTNSAIVHTESFDSGITVSEAVYMMSSSIYDLHWKVRADVP